MRGRHHVEFRLIIHIVSPRKKIKVNIKTKSIIWNNFAQLLPPPVPAWIFCRLTVLKTTRNSTMCWQSTAVARLRDRQTRQQGEVVAYIHKIHDNRLTSTINQLSVNYVHRIWKQLSCFPSAPPPPPTVSQGNSGPECGKIIWWETVARHSLLAASHVQTGRRLNLNYGNRDELSFLPTSQCLFNQSEGWSERNVVVSLEGQSSSVWCRV